MLPESEISSIHPNLLKIVEDSRKNIIPQLLAVFETEEQSSFAEPGDFLCEDAYLKRDSEIENIRQSYLSAIHESDSPGASAVYLNASTGNAVETARLKIKADPQLFKVEATTTASSNGSSPEETLLQPPNKGVRKISSPHITRSRSQSEADYQEAVVKKERHWTTVTKEIGAEEDCDFESKDASVGNKIQSTRAAFENDHLKTGEKHGHSFKSENPGSNLSPGNSTRTKKQIANQQELAVSRERYCCDIPAPIQFGIIVEAICIMDLAVNTYRRDLGEAAEITKKAELHMAALIKRLPSEYAKRLLSECSNIETEAREDGYKDKIQNKNLGGRIVENRRFSIQNAVRVTKLDRLKIKWQEIASKFHQPSYDNMEKMMDK